MIDALRLVLLVAPVAVGAVAIGARSRPDAPPRARLAAAGLAAVVWLVVAFEILATASRFTWGAATAASWLFALAATRGAAGRVAARLSADVAAARDVAAALSATDRATLGLAVAFIGAQWLRALAYPPSGWDDLVYHLVRAGRWVQHGGFARDAAPDAWRYYEYFPYASDAIAAFSMLPDHGDAFVVLATGAWTFANAFGAYAVARELGVSPRGALYAGVGLVLVPALIVNHPAASADAPATLVWLLGAVFVARALRAGDGADAAFAILGAAAALAMRVSALPMFGFTALVAVAAVLRGSAPRRGLAGVALGAVIAAPLLVGYARNAAANGNPLYPVAVSLGPIALPGNPWFAAMNTDTYRGDVPFDPLVAFVALFADPGFFVVGHQYNFGLAPLLLAVPAAGGLVAALRSPATRAFAAYLAVVALLTVAPLASPSMIAMWTAHLSFVARYVLPAAAVVFVFAAVRLEGSRAWPVLLAVGALYALPPHVGALDRVVLVGFVAPLAAAALVGALAARTFGPRIGAAATVALLGLAWPVAAETRAALRYPLWRAAIAEPPTRILTLSPYVCAPDVWQAVDDGEAHRIAYTAGWDGVGQKQARYPLLGSQLRNEVIYVPVTDDGAIVDYVDRVALAPRLDEAAWRRRLRERGVDRLVIGPDAPPEARWAATRPDCFEPLVEAPHHTLYRVLPCAE